MTAVAILSQSGLFLATFAIAAWAGAIALLSFVVAPTTFRNLSPPPPKFLHVLFTRYYLLGEILNVLAILGLATLLLRLGDDAFPLAKFVLLAAIVVVSFAICGYSRRVLTPNIQRFRGKEEHKAQFDRLHKLSVRLNSAMLFGALGGCWLAVQTAVWM
jgi:hypothetical protein